MLDALKRSISLVVEATDHAHRIEVIIEQKAESEAAALANAITPEVKAAQADLQAGIEALTARLASTRKMHEGVAAAGAAVVSAVVAPPSAPASDAVATSGRPVF